MQRASYSLKILTNRRKFSTKSIDSSKKNSKYQSKPIDNLKRIPLIIKQIQQNLHQLKTCYEEQIMKQGRNHEKIAIRKTSRPHSSCVKNKNKNNEQQIVDQETINTVPELQELKKSFINTYGYDSNNIVELYNFYKKNAQKSTKLFASTSLSGVINLTQNHSQLRDKGIKINYGNISEDNYKGKQSRSQLNNYLQYEQSKLPLVKNQNMLKKANEMVSVANLLADKKKISRRNICENINSENLLNQAKRKLYRANPCENIEKFNKIKESLKNQHVKTISSKKIQEIREKSSSKKENRAQQPKQNSQKISQFFLVEKDSQKIKSSAKQQQKFINKSIELSRIEEFKGEISAFQLQTGGKQNKISNQKQKPIEKQKQNKECKDNKSAKSSRSLKQVKSPDSFKSPELNRGILMDLTGSGELSSKKNTHHQGYFLPKVHSNLHDSLLNCQITPKQQSKILDLESIPFDF